MLAFAGSGLAAPRSRAGDGAAALEGESEMIERNVAAVGPQPRVAQ